MRIILINPWIYDFAAYNMWARPLGLLQVAEWFSAYTRDMVLIDCLAEPENRQYHTSKYTKTPVPNPPGLEMIPRRYGRYGISLHAFDQQLRQALPADAILITSVMTYWYPGVQAAIQRCRALAPGVPILLGGLYPRFFPEHARQYSGADLVFSGRIEDLTVPHALAQVGLHLPPAGPRIPFHQLGFYPQTHYAPLLFSQGCPFHCSYCASHFLHPTMQHQTPEKMFEQFQTQAQTGVQDFAFYDDALLYQSETFLHPFLERVQQSGWQGHFHTPNGLHACYLDAKSARLMHQTGFKTIRLSLETVDPLRQSHTGGKVQQAQFETAMNNLLNAGFSKSELGVYLMYGLPGQPLDEVQAGVRYLQPFPARIYMTEFSPLPHTQAWQELVDSKIIPPDIDPLLTNNSVFSQLFANYSAEELQQLKRITTLHNRDSE